MRWIHGTCEEVLDTKRDLKIHTYKHSYTTENRTAKCDTCHFECDTVDTMEVHVGKCRQNNFKCGLCEVNFDKISDLEIHLKTCEIYQCGSCYIRDTNLSEMKKHVQETHSSTDIADTDISVSVSVELYCLLLIT